MIEVATIDKAGAVESEESVPGRVKRILQSIKKFATLSEVLRIFGAVIMVASMSVFLLQGWSEGNDIQRYLKLLAQTGLLAAGGFLLSYLFKEYKGARLFFGLALLSVPANFTILGALIYSLFIDTGGQVAALSLYPQFASWIVADSVYVGWVLAGAMAVLVPVTLLGIKIMARRSVKPLSLGFLLMNAVLLIPLRDSWAVAVMLAIAILIPGWIIARQYTEDTTLSTAEGKYALLLLLVPAGLLLGRSFYLYQVDALPGLVAFASLYFVIRQWSMAMQAGSGSRLLAEGFTVPLAYGAAICSMGLMLAPYSEQITLTVFAAVLGMFTLDYVTRATDTVLKSIVLAATSLIIALSMVLALLINCTVIATMLTGFFGTGLIMLGMIARQRLIILIGLVTIIATTFIGLQDVIAMLIHSSWLGLAIIGGAAIISASLLDRYGAMIKLRLSGWSSSLNKR